MSDAIRCPSCGFVYWTGAYENWGTCDSCGSNNNFWKGRGDGVTPMLVDSKFARKYTDLKIVLRKVKSKKKNANKN